MNCEQFEKEMEELEDYSSPSAEFEAHLRACVSCSELLEDLNSIRQQARELVAAEEPNDRVWQQVRKGLRREGLIAEPTRRLFARPAFGWLPRLSMGVAYATVFLVALGVVYVYSIISLRVPAPPLPAAPNPPFAQLFEKVSPEKRALYVSNLNQVDTSIQQWKTFLADHPEDPFARQQLFNNYEQKARLWDSLVRWEEF
jgi:hypothetical protein